MLVTSKHPLPKRWRLVWKTTMTTKPKRGGKRSGAGRPVTDAGTLPARQFGRVNDADWQTLQEAFAAVGFVRWALPTLLKKAMREKKRK